MHGVGLQKAQHLICGAPDLYKCVWAQKHMAFLSEKRQNDVRYHTCFTRMTSGAASVAKGVGSDDDFSS